MILYKRLRPIQVGNYIVLYYFLVNLEIYAHNCLRPFYENNRMWYENEALLEKTS